MKETNIFKDVGLALIVGLFAIILRLIFTKAPIDADTFFYMSNAVQGNSMSELLLSIGTLFGFYGLTIFHYTTTFLVFCLFYFLCRKYASQLNSLLASLLFAFSPIIYLNSYFTFFDKNVLCLLFIIFILLIDTIKEIYKFIGLFITFIFFAYSWQIWFIIALFYILWYIYEYKTILIKSFSFKEPMKIVFYACLIGIISVVITKAWDFAFFFLQTDKALTSELVPIWNVFPYIEYLIVILVYIVLIRTIKINFIFFNNYKKEIFLLLYLLFGMIIAFRISIFAMVLVYLFFAILLEEWEGYFKNWQKIVIWSVLFIIITVPSIADYSTKSFLNDAIVDATIYARNLNSSCIIGSWDKGYFYEFMTNKTVLYEATPRLYKEQINYMVYGKKTNCTIIYSNQDLKGLMYMANHDGLKINYSDIYVYNTNVKTFISKENYINYYVVIQNE